MSTAEFDPTRSAAIRQLLLDTVAETPRRERRTRFAIIGALTGAALAVAGGTAALALTGVLHFGAPEQPPAPLPTPSQTVTPTPTPEPTVTEAPRPLVQANPIAPHDVDTLPATPTWSLDLPGANDECRGTNVYDLSDGRALFLTGVRPKEYEGGPCGEKPDVNTEDMGLALVDTEHGSVLWTREWSFTRDYTTDDRPAFLVLGTSGRGLFDSGRHGVPGEVLDLSDGSTVAPFEHPDSDVPLRDDAAVAGPSGDLLLIQEQRGDDGRSIADTVIERVDPRDAGHPRWSTELPGVSGTFTGPAATLSSVGVSYYPQDASIPSAGQLDVETGAFTPLPIPAPQVAGDVAVSVDTATDTVVVTDASGAELWRHSGWGAQYVADIPTADAMPTLGAWSPKASSGLLAIATPTGSVIVQAATGAVVVADTGPACGPTPPSLFDGNRDVLLVTQGDNVCALTLSSGDQTPPTGIPSSALWLAGTTNAYASFWPATSGTAYDLATGEARWSRELRDRESWHFAGGYLVSVIGTHIESLG
jgi:hypothetical protein